jgi:hypothetical protein
MLNFTEVTAAHTTTHVLLYQALKTPSNPFTAEYS